MKNEALELVKSLRKLLEQVKDPQHIDWERLKKEMDELIAKEEARPQPKPIRVAAKKKVVVKPKKKGGRDRDTVRVGGLEYGPPHL